MRTAHPDSLLMRRLGAFAACTLALAFVVSCSRAPLTAPKLAQRPGATPTANSDGEGYEIVVTVAPGVDPAQLAHDNGATLVHFSEGIATLAFPPFDLPEKVVSGMSTDSRVLTAEPNAWLEPAEALQRAFSFDDGLGTATTYNVQPAGDQIHLAGGLVTSQGEDVPVAILDTGADLTHPMLASSIIGGYDFIDNDANPTDAPDGVDNDGDGYVDEAFGHGTHVAGIVKLTAPRSRLLIVRVLDSDGRGDVRTVAAGVHWAADHGARVINMSLGMLSSSPAIRKAIADAQLRGVVCVASAGNRGTEWPQEFPAVSPDVIAVAAVDGLGHPADFTSYGTYVGLCAPGVGIRSTFPGGRYRLWSGTSMSAGFVSGAAALLIAAHPTWGRAQVLSRLQAYTRPITGATLAQQGKLGAGSIDLGQALRPDAAGSPSDQNGNTPIMDWAKR
jgi:subtilisin family serine protease